MGLFVKLIFKTANIVAVTTINVLYCSGLKGVCVNPFYISVQHAGTRA